MLTYPQINSRWSLISPGGDLKSIEEYLVDQWLDDYFRLTANLPTQVVETTNTGFSYLFDIEQERLIAAWGISQGKNTEPRPASRMKGHPLGAGKGYHRGHAIPHTLGGATDINLVAQKGSVNVGAFRVLENRAIQTPGALYFTYWEYQNSSSQKPSRVQQGLLCPGGMPDIRWHTN